MRQKGLSQVMPHKLCVNWVAKGRNLSYALILQFASSKTAGRNCSSSLVSKLYTFEDFGANRSHSESIFLIYSNFQMKTWNYKEMQEKYIQNIFQSCFSQNAQNRVMPFCNPADDIELLLKMLKLHLQHKI